jgi:hypothetical protein
MKLFTLFISAAFIQGCGPARPMPLPVHVPRPPQSERLDSSEFSESKKAPLEKSLKLTVYSRVSGTPLMPTDRIADRIVDQLVDQIITEDQIIFTHPFPHQGQGLLFVGQREFLDTLIVQGTITYRIWNATNQWTLDLVTIPIKFDSIKNIWFVVISDLLTRRPSDLSPDSSAETQVFILEVGLANHTNKTIEIRFRIQDF